MLQYFSWLKSEQTDGVEDQMQKFVMLPWHASLFMRPAWKTLRIALLFNLWGKAKHEPYNYFIGLKEEHEALMFDDDDEDGE